ncbi:MAG: flippase-like domain-containing protein [Candidatus Eremiobacteraeota bacterium]|nr:flippase-like domain-containing protein [Candidatus Eremiobacteraeota bacterium]
MNKKRIGYGQLVRLLITVSLLALLFSRISAREVLEIVDDVRWPNMAGAILLTLLGAGLNTWKWQILLADQDMKVSFHKLFYLFLVGFFFNNLLLSGSGDLKRIYDLSKEQGDLHKVFTSVLLERWTGAMSLLIWVSTSLLFAIPIFKGLIWVCLLSILLLILGFLFLPLLDRIIKLRIFSRITPLKNFLDQMPETTGFYKRIALWMALAISLIPPFIMIILHYILGRGVGLELPFFDYLQFIPTIMAVSYLPISVNGLGVQESGFFILFSLKNIKGAESFSLSVLSHLAKIAVGILGGILYFVEGFRNSPSGDS